MRTLESLKKEAEKSARFRGHKIHGRWTDNWNGTSSIATCSICDAYVQVETKPAPNGIDIGGTAVAVGCESCNLRIYKSFKDNLSFPVKLEAKIIGIHTDDRGKRWNVWKPISDAWWGLYRLEPVNGGRGRYLVDSSVMYANKETTFEARLEVING